jgi:hypothetical protein
MFKGTFAANLKLLYDRTGNPAYQAYLRRNASSVWDRDRRAGAFGLHWAGPFDAAGTARQAAALDVLSTQLPGRDGLSRGGRVVERPRPLG